MICQHCGGPVEWDFYDPSTVSDPDSLHTVCLWCGMPDSQRTDLSNRVSSDKVDDEYDATYIRRRRADLGLDPLPKKKREPKMEPKPREVLHTRRGYTAEELSIITDSSLSMGQAMRMLDKAGYQRTYNAVAVWRSTHKELMVVPKEGKP